MSSLRQTSIFHLKPLISNFHCKLSAITEYDPKKQVLCVVSMDNEILLRYTNDGGSMVLKLISWFSKSARVIHDVCFDPTGCWLLVLCFDNTLHIVPALKLLDASQVMTNSSFSTTELTSFVIPFVGPHECPSSKTCPNHDLSTTPSSSPVHLAEYVFEPPHKDSSSESAKAAPIPPVIIDANTDPQNAPFVSMDVRDPSSAETSRKSSKNDAASTISHSNETNATSRNSTDSFLTSSTCPYPISAVWWQTLDKRNRAVIGYSDGSICFVGLSPNCPFIANTSIENGGILKLFVCRDNSMENVTLLINSSIKQQWKLLLEQKCINYTFPGDISPSGNQQNDSSREDWQFVMPIKSSEQSFLEGSINNEISKPDESTSSSPQDGQSSSGSSDQRSQENEDAPNNRSGILPAAKARLALLKTLGTKKLNALKMKLSEQKFKMDEYMSDGALGSFAIVDSPTTSPEILTTPSGPYFVVQNLRNTYLLSALHNYSDTLSVHSMDISLIPLFLYKIPKYCQEVLIGSNLLYAIQLVPNNEPEFAPKECDVKSDETNTNESDSSDKSASTEERTLNAVSVISSAMASMKNGEEIEFNEKALLGTFSFPGETVINVYRMASFPIAEKPMPKEESNDTLQSAEIRSPAGYVRHQRKNKNETYSLSDIEFMQNEFPKINYDPCIVVTNKNTYFVDLQAPPYEIFLSSALRSDWATCEEFCTTFDLHFQQCIEFAGDYLLRKKKVTQALLTYNVARIPPVRTALKLAIFGENYALMHLCAMALKCVFVLKSTHFSKPIIKLLFDGADFRHTENISNLLPKRPDTSELVNEGKSCSDFNYSVDESTSSLQMSASSQFHLSNLLLITLAERSVKEKNYVPLWNFLVTNTKFHTNMTSIVLCQSGLYSSALLLALMRGACIDVFVGLVSVANQEFGWYTELNVLLYNLSDTIFVECVTYLRHISTDYFNIVQDKLGKIEANVLERLEKQLNPFSSAFRPIVFNLPLKSFDSTVEDNYSDLSTFCKVFIETYLGIILQLESLRSKPDSLLNALTSFKLNHEDNQFAIESSKFPPISVGCSHSACVIDGCAYFWGSNGVPFVYSVTKSSDPPEPPHAIKSLDIISQLNLEVHAVKCGRLHSLVLTNNGLYSFGSNQLGQLGIKSRMLCALQPMLVEAFENKRITILEAGQYHNAAVADDQLYTWGWGVYGQLGHGDTENCLQPKEVSFFKGMKVQQVSLGHAHSLILCSVPNGSTNLYVFGSNHFGQLGVGLKHPFRLKETNLVKSVVPLKLEFSESPIRLIHTKFFSNLAVNEKNELYTWGSSPQALRLANQIKRRATAKQKIEENLRKEINKRIESNKDVETDSTKEDVGSKLKNFLKKSGELCSGNEINIECVKTQEESTSLPSTEADAQKMEIEMKELKIENKSENNTTIPSIPFIKIDYVATPSNEEETTSTENNEAPASDFVQVSSTSSKKLPEKKRDTIEPESTDHLFPLLVDTSEVSGQILQMSTGLFHYALISSTLLLYTWGKNLEHQLGTEDKDRKAVSKPTPLESIENPLHVECGADFTVVITTQYVVKAFGGNTNGQCGRDLGPPIDKSKAGKLFCLPTTKRLMRLEGQCVEEPSEIYLPRPRIQMDPEPIRYLKSVPKFKPQLVQRSGLSLDVDTGRSVSSCGNLQDAESDDVASSVENVSGNEEDSLCSTAVRVKYISPDVSPDEESREFQSELSVNDFRHYVHYCLYIFHGLYDANKISEFAKNSPEFRIRVLMLNFKFVEAFKVCLTECQTAQKSIKVFEFFTKDTSIVPMRRQDLKYFIYELFIHFLSQKFDMVECEKFFLSDLDYYLFELSFVLFFNNNNTEMEQQLNKKFKDFFLPDMNEEHKLEDTDKIFDSLSVKFKSIVCQRLLQVSEN